MQFYMLQHQRQPEADVYVNRQDFDEAVSEAVNEARHDTFGNVAAEEIERRVRARTHTCASLAEVDGMVEREAGQPPQWLEMGRSHDGKQESWRDPDYRGGNAELYRLAAESLRNAEDETMGYDQDRFYDPGLPEALSVDDIDPESTVVTDKMAAAVHPCETAACAAGHVYVCVHGWRKFPQTCVRAQPAITTPSIANRSAAELGMSEAQRSALFPASRN